MLWLRSGSHRGSETRMLGLFGFTVIGCDNASSGESSGDIYGPPRIAIKHRCLQTRGIMVLFIATPALLRQKSVLLNKLALLFNNR